MVKKGAKSVKLLSAVLGLLLLSISAATQASCELEQYSQFDFWLGTWEVQRADGTVVGRNTISKSLANCVILEAYTTSTGYAGNSMNTFNIQTGQWHQTWMDNGGLMLILNGEFDGKAMVLSGPGKSSTGEAILHRITWTPKAEHSVRQHWQTSSDNGQHWTTVFDGHYFKIQ